MRFAALGLILGVAACVRPTYENVNPAQLLAGVKEAMTEKQVVEVAGKPDDTEAIVKIWTEIAWYPLTLLIIPAFFHPPYSESLYYYKGEGRVLLRTGWGGDVNLRVIRVIGDPTEDGYR